MIKDFLLVRAATNVPEGKLGYREYVEAVHAPLSMANPAIAREMKRFTLNHLVDDAGLEYCLYSPFAGLTTVVEHVVGGWEGFERIVTDAQYLADVRPDEDYMVETLMDGQPDFIVVDEELTIFSSDSWGSARMFDFLRRPEKISREAFLDGLEDDAAWAAAQPQYRTSVARRVHSVVGGGAAPIGANSREPYDAVVEVWITDAAQLAKLMDEQGEKRAVFCDSNRSFTAMTQERRIV